ncbi:MAG: translocated intimin receptor Tir [Terriglobia bacterium]
MKRSFVKAILTDGHFWIPLSVLVLGVLLLIYVH